ncbi:hypothetical protein ACM258_18950 [Phaeobacter piscinae]|uniref:hypothetical protein n=1 Tax=Phaeobacter piscinae TaxID=1580596 RepID=UPI0039F6D691
MKTKRVFDGQRGVITSIFVASIFVNLLVLTAPLYMLQLFARVMASGSMPTLIALTTGAAIALVFFFSSLMSFANASSPASARGWRRG